MFPAPLSSVILFRSSHNGRTNPHDHIEVLTAFRNEVNNLSKGETARAYIGGMTIVIWHRDCALRLHYELVMY